MSETWWSLNSKMSIGTVNNFLKAKVAMSGEPHVGTYGRLQLSANQTPSGIAVTGKLLKQVHF